MGGFEQITEQSELLRPANERVSGPELDSIEVAALERLAKVKSITATMMRDDDLGVLGIVP
jgi:hypothetical protein